MDNMEQLQVVVNEVQSARQQLANLRAQVLELETTLESVKSQPERPSTAPANGRGHG